MNNYYIGGCHIYYADREWYWEIHKGIQGHETELECKIALRDWLSIAIAELERVIAEGAE